MANPGFGCKKRHGDLTTKLLSSFLLRVEGVRVQILFFNVFWELTFIFLPRGVRFSIVFTVARTRHYISLTVLNKRRQTKVNRKLKRKLMKDVE